MQRISHWRRQLSSRWKKRRPGIVPAALLFPFYFLLTSLAGLLPGKPSHLSFPLLLGSPLDPALIAFVWTIAGARLQPLRSVWYFLITWTGLFMEGLNQPQVPFSAKLQWVNVGLCLYLLDTLIDNLTWRIPRRLAKTGVFLLSSGILAFLGAIVLYNRSRGVGLDEPSLLAIWETNSNEAAAFIVTQIGKSRLIVYSSALGVLMGLHFLFARIERTKTFPRIGVLAPAFLLLLSGANRKNSSVVSLIEESLERYRIELSELESGMAQRRAIPGGLQAEKQGPPETYVLVIGESHSRDHMGIHGYARDTTPWLETMVRDPGFLLFQKAFSNHTHTTRVLTLALTEANQYRPGYYWSLPSLIDVANAAGFETHWLSAQGHIGAHDSPITLLAQASHDTEWLRDKPSPAGLVGDARLIPRLQERMTKLDLTRNNFIVLHLMGSHWPYCAQFPPEESHFQGAPTWLFGAVATRPDVMQRLDCYDNAVRYTDKVLHELFETARGIPNLAAFAYFSDHGEELINGYAHTVAEFDFSMVRIPFWIWLSPEHRLRRPEVFQALRSHRDDCFTNDLVHDTMVGLMGIDTPHFSPHLSLASRRFSLPCSAARTVHGQMPLAQHPHLFLQQKMASLRPKEPIARDVGTVAKLTEGLSHGFREFEISLVWDENHPEGERLRLGRSLRQNLDGSLNDLLRHPRSALVRRFFFNIKELKGEGSLLPELHALEERYPGLRKRVVVETEGESDMGRNLQSRGWAVGVRISPSFLEGGGEAVNRRLAWLKRPSGLVAEPELYTGLKAHLSPETLRHLQVALVLPGETDDEALKPYVRDPRVRGFLLPFSSPFEP